MGSGSIGSADLCRGRGYPGSRMGARGWVFAHEHHAASAGQPLSRIDALQSMPTIDEVLPSRSRRHHGLKPTSADFGRVPQLEEVGQRAVLRTRGSPPRCRRRNRPSRTSATGWRGSLSNGFPQTEVPTCCGVLVARKVFHAQAHPRIGHEISVDRRDWATGLLRVAADLGSFLSAVERLDRRRRCPRIHGNCNVGAMHPLSAYSTNPDPTPPSILPMAKRTTSSLTVPSGIPNSPG